MNFRRYSNKRLYSCMTALSVDYSIFAEECLGNKIEEIDLEMMFMSEFHVRSFYLKRSSKNFVIVGDFNVSCSISRPRTCSII